MNRDGNPPTNPERRAHARWFERKKQLPVNPPVKRRRARISLEYWDARDLWKKVQKIEWLAAQMRSKNKIRVLAAKMGKLADEIESEASMQMPRLLNAIREVGEFGISLELLMRTERDCGEDGKRDSIYIFRWLLSFSAVLKYGIRDKSPLMSAPRVAAMLAAYPEEFERVARMTVAQYLKRIRVLTDRHGALLRELQLPQQCVGHYPEYVCACIGWKLPTAAASLRLTAWRYES